MTTAPTIQKYSDPGVFRDEHRHTCIVVGADARYVKFVEMSAEEFSVRKMALPGFEANYEAMPDYAPGRAARLYLETARSHKIPITREAETLLSAIADAKFDRAAAFPASKPTTEDEDPVMSDEKPKKNPAPAKKAAAAEKPAAKKTAAPAKKPAPAAKKAAAAAEPAGTRGRAPNISGDAVITLVAKENPKRGGAAELPAWPSRLPSTGCRPTPPQRHRAGRRPT